jgi:uncharacterized protein with GYD domain
MPTYISLVNFTDQGVRAIKDTVNRANAAKDLAKNMGGEIREIYWTLGTYDLVVVSEFPDNATGMAFIGAVGSQGNIRTTTLQAFTAEEMSQALSKMG